MLFILGLKCSLNEKQILDRLSYNPDLIELHLFDSDMYGAGRSKLESVIIDLLDRDIDVVLHHPMFYNRSFQDILAPDLEVRSFFDFSTQVLISLCKKYHIKCVVHPQYSQSNTLNETELYDLKDRMNYFNELADGCILWENSIVGLTTFENERVYEDIIGPLNLPFCFDISHAFISFKGDNDKLIHALEKCKHNIKYFHVVDSIGMEHDSLKLGMGSIDWSRVFPYIKDKKYIFEIGLSDQEDCREMLESFEYLNRLKSSLEGKK